MEPSAAAGRPNNPTRQPRALSTALALSGGAAHGDFEVGVVRYLYEHRAVKPHILCGTSVGSIAALKLAEGEPKAPAKPDANGHLQGLAGLEHIWLGLQRDSDMFEKEPDLVGKLKADAEQWLKDTAIQLGCMLAFGPISLLFTKDPSDEMDTVMNDLANVEKIRSLYNLNPTSALMAKPSSLNVDMLKASGIRLRLAMVALDDGQLRYVTETGQVLEKDGTPTLNPPDYDPKCAGPIRKKIAALQAELDDMQDSLRDADGPLHGSVAGASGLVRQINALRAELAKCPKTQTPLTIDVRTGALASSSIPLVFPPVKIGTQWYVDGGVRMITPIRAALDMGADFVYAVVASSDKLDPAIDLLSESYLRSFDPPANLLDIAGRAGMDIMPNQIADDNLNPPNGFGKPVIVIQPEVDIHDGMTIDPGLIRIRMAHGFMRADDTMQAYDKNPANYRTLVKQYSAERETTLIVTLRRKIWQAEFAANGWRYQHSKTGSPGKPVQMPAPDADAIEKVRHWKRELKTLVSQRIAAGGLVPPDCDQWWMDWEKHSWKPLQPLWDALHPFVPLKILNAKVQPTQLPLNRDVTFTVVADDHGTPVTDAGVFVNGTRIGSTGQAIHYRFAAKSVTVFDPDTKQRTVELIPPSFSVAKPGYVTVDLAPALA